MDEANQKMEALKKAYADIIFNTTKEAAAKIMVAERRAYQYQKEMFEAKQEALTMLVRFKTMMDSRIGEAEILAFNQRRKIEELEAQVHKAEDVANDFRAELNAVKEDLGKMKTSRLQPSDKRIVKGSAAFNDDVSQENHLTTPDSVLLYPWGSGPGPLSSSDMKNVHFHQIHTIDHCSSASKKVSMPTSHQSNSPDETYYAGNPDLLSIIRRVKEPHLYRSGCTQRICAFDRNRLNGTSSPHLHTDNPPSRKNKASNIGVIKKNPSGLGELLQQGDRCDKGQDKFFRVPCRKRGARSRKARSTLCNNQILKAPVGTAISGSETELSPDNNITKSSEDPSRKLEETDNEISLFPLAPVLPWNTTNMDSKLGCGVGVQTDADEAKIVHNVTNGDKVSIDDSHLATQEKQDPDSSEVSDLIKDLKKVEVPLVITDSKNDENCDKKVKVPLVNSDTQDDENGEMSNEAPMQDVDDKFFKFRFRRKRKRASLISPDESASLENNTSKKRPREMQKNDPEPPNTVESSRDDRRLMQVARQLISLKNKKWWQ